MVMVCQAEPSRALNGWLLVTNDETPISLEEIILDQAINGLRKDKNKIARSDDSSNNQT
jgi:hypothetical protein